MVATSKSSGVVMRRILALALVTFVTGLGISTVFAAQTQETVYEPGPGVTLPRVLKAQSARYTPEAMKQGVQGTVWLQVVVRADGSVGEVTVTRELEPSLDKQAVEAALQWLFDPGKREGKPVAVRVTIEMTFTLKDKPKGN
jgi:TonB family protein